MKNAYQRRRVKARVEKRARMRKLDAITLDFTRQVIEEETGAPLEIKAPSADAAHARAAEAESGGNGAASEARFIARDERKNPLISTFEWTNDAAQRILRVPAGFMRNQTQERVEELARERAAAAIDLALVEDGIEIGKRMMAEMIANYPSQGKSPGVAAETRNPAGSSAASNGNGYLNEVSARPAAAAGRPAAGEHRDG